MRLLSSLLVLVALVAAPGGCGLFGRTKAKPLHDLQPLSVPLQVHEVALEPNTKLQNVGTFAIGEYGARDLSTLEQTLEQSLDAAAKPQGDEFRVHVLVRRFLVAHSNNAGLAVACVAWALTNPEGELVFHEQFYAADSVRLWGTIGGLKNHVHQGISRHILDQASQVASGEGPLPVRGEYVFPTYDSAAAVLPDSLTSVHVASFGFGAGYSFAMWTVQGSSERSWVREEGHVDWPARLALRPSSSPAAATVSPL